MDSFGEIPNLLFKTLKITSIIFSHQSRSAEQLHKIANSWFLMTCTRLRKRKKVPYVITHFTAVMNKTLYDTQKWTDKIQIFFFPLLPLCMNFDTTGYTKRSWWTLWPASGVLWSLLVLYQLMALTTNFLLIQPSCSKPKECEMRHLCQRTKRQHLFFLIFFPIIAHI